MNIDHVSQDLMLEEKRAVQKRYRHIREKIEDLATASSFLSEALELRNEPREATKALILTAQVMIDREQAEAELELRYLEKLID